jgi:hypothetical protein
MKFLNLMRKNKNTFGFFIVLLLSILPYASIAQVRIDSPYSRFGIGDVNSSNNAKTDAMGGLSFSISDANHINTNNPASYAAMDSGSFVFDAGFKGLMLNSKSLGGTSESNYFNLGHLKVAMPITRWLRASIGLMPFTAVGYDVKGSDQIDSIGTVEHRYTGDGGLNRFYLGAGIKIIKNLHVGVNASYVFGKGTYNRETFMLDQANAFKVRATNQVDVGSFYFDYGIQYMLRISDKEKDQLGNKRPKFLKFGFIYANKQNLSSELNSKAITFTNGSDDFEFIKDTVFLDNGHQGDVVIPAKFGGGLSYYSGNKWMIGFDMKYQDWSKYEAFGKSDSLVSSLTYNIGGAYRIKGFSFRAGFRYFDSYLQLKNHKIDDYGISFGVGFPLRQNSMTISYVDLGFEFGRRGTTSDGLIEQNYFKVNLGITIRNTWFQRTKYQ